ncbi:MAG: DNA repair protein RadC [Prevotella sp.]
MKLSIKDWDEADMPREKLERLGAEALSNAELLAILIGSGSTKESAVDLMKRIMSDCNNSLNALGKLTISDLTKYNGVGPAKAITILAACELGKRRQMEKPEERVRINSAIDIYTEMHPVMQDLDVEEGWVLLMNQNFKLIKKMCISRGGLTETAIDVRVIMKHAIMSNATVVALCHNHPSGGLRPSRFDDSLTDKVKEACKLMRLFFLDHVIVTDGGYYSYSEEGRI